VIALWIASAALSACAAPPRISAGDHAIALYRERWARPPGSDAKRPDSAGVPRTLSADEAVALAKRKSARLAELSAHVETAAAETLATDVYPNPEVRISQLRLDQLIDGSPRLEAAVRLSPARPGEIAAEVAEARAAEAEARAEARVGEIELESEIRWMFDDVRLLDAEIEALDAVAATRRRLAEQLRVRVEGALSTAVEEAAAALSAAEAEGDSAEQRARRATALAALLERLGIEAGAPVRLVGEPVTEWPLADLPTEEALVESALRSRPEIELAEARLAEADARGSLARGKRWPWFSFVQLGYEFSPATRTGLGWTFQAGIELPIFDTGRRGVLLSDAARAAAQRAFAAAVERVARDARDRLREARAAAVLVGEFRERALPAAARAAAESARALESRQIDVIRALAIDQRSVAAQVRYLRLLRTYRTAVAELRLVTSGRIERSSAGDPRGVGVRAAGR
jgi:outer membrane protein, heavy metal efflux system